VNDLQDDVAAAADRAEAHANAPALLMQTQAALGKLATITDQATQAGRRPFRVPPEWSDALAELAYLVYLLADQTGVSVDTAVRGVSARISAEGVQRRAEESAREADRWL
jgi:hypothetical protein